ncbi:MAG: phosphodiesterase, partial [Phototrophicales bacterium]
MKIPFIKKNKRRRVAIIGLDCAEPALVFEQFAGHLPNLDRLRQQGIYGNLESVVPPITVPAWACMTSGKDPGTLGIYGFRNRADFTYDTLQVATAQLMREPRLWDILSQHNTESIILGVPLTYPVKPIKGNLVSSFLTPGLHSQFTHPPELKDDIAQWVGDYMFDVPGFRTADKAWLLEQIYAMTKQHFEVARRLITQNSWDFFMMVEMGLDRIQHGFWKDHDVAHRKHDSSSPHKNVIREYYRYLDLEIGTLLGLFDEDTIVLIVSDHGAKKMDGGIAINEWLIHEGYLVLHESPSALKAPVRHEDLNIDWRRTRAWGEGGYCGRIFLNIEGREPQGIVSHDAYESLRDELMQKLEALGDEHGNPIGTRCYKPEEIYQTVRGIAPDLLVYFGDLYWRSIGTVGWDAIHVFENDTGPDDSNHSQQGIFIYHDP